MITTMLAGDFLGLPIPDAGPIFAAALLIHILSGVTAVISGALAATAKKRPGRHPRAGRIYLWALGGVFVTATVMASSMSPASHSVSTCSSGSIAPLSMMARTIRM